MNKMRINQLNNDYPDLNVHDTDQLNNLVRIVAFCKWDELSPFQNGTD